MAEKRDNHGRDPQYVRVLGGPNGDQFVDLSVLGDSYETVNVVIANGQSLSAELDTGGRSIAAIIMPSAWTAAVLTFQGAGALAAGGGVYGDIYDDNGNELTVQASASRAIGLDQSALALSPYQFIKVRSGTSSSGVNQGGARTLQVLLKSR
jgi:hypothetical protein